MVLTNIRCQYVMGRNGNMRMCIVFVSEERETGRLMDKMVKAWVCLCLRAFVGGCL